MNSIQMFFVHLLFSAEEKGRAFENSPLTTCTKIPSNRRRGKQLMVMASHQSTQKTSVAALPIIKRALQKKLPSIHDESISDPDDPIIAGFERSQQYRSLCSSEYTRQAHHGSAIQSRRERSRSDGAIESGNALELGSSCHGMPSGKTGNLRK
jgi:hypothetical protein